MPNTVTEKSIAVTVPSPDRFVVNHHNEAKAAIDAMSVWRQHGAETNLRSWCRVVESIDPVRENGRAFSGPELQAGAQVSLPVGAIIVACDVSWANARWYAGQHMKRMEIEAGLHEVTADGLTELTRSMRRAWARDLIGWLLTSRPDISKKARVFSPKGAA